MADEIKKLRESQNGNEIFAIPLGTVEGTETEFKSGKKGYRIFGQDIIDGQKFQIIGQIVKL